MEGAMVRTRRIGVMAGSLTAIALLQGLISCSDGFSGQDCHASRTCPVTGDAGEGGGEPSGSGGADSSVGGSNGTSDAGAAGAEGQSLTVIEISPESDASEVALDAAIVITFSEPLDSGTVTSETVRVLDGETEVAGDLTYADGTVTFTPTEPFSLLVDYSVEVTTDVTDADGVPLAEPFASRFTTRDGVWHTDALPTAALDEQLPLSIPMAANGDTLLAWPSQSSGSEICSTSARWFNRGEPITPVEIFSTTLAVDICFRVGVGANSDGVAAVVSGGYQVNDENVAIGMEGTVHEFRSGEWKRVGSIGSDGVGIATRADGTILYVAQAFPGTRAYASTEDGLSSEVQEIGGTDYGYSFPILAFEPEGDGWAAWQAVIAGTASPDDDQDEILVARYTVDGGWKAATTLPGSVAPSSSFRRGQPALAVDHLGGAMLVWVRGGSNEDSGELVASRFTAGGGWDDPVLLSGPAIVVDRGFAPALVFDGETYVAAWPGSEGGSVFPYTARYDLAAAKWSLPDVRTESAIIDAMPRLGVDAHRNLLMTWVASRPGGKFLFYTRYRASTDQWSQPTPVTDEPLGGGAATGQPSPLSVNAMGLGALMWGVAPDYNYPATLYYASFH